MKMMNQKNRDLDLTMMMKDNPQKATERPRNKKKYKRLKRKKRMYKKSLLRKSQSKRERLKFLSKSRKSKLNIRAIENNTWLKK